ncbi:MAG: hypothetical protein WDZ57_02980 [Demequina sp.]
MLLVTRDAVGTRVFARMVRTGMVNELTPSVALAADVPSTPWWRALAVRPLVPAHTVLSGLGGLWVHLDGKHPDQLIVVGHRGLHRTVTRPPHGDMSARFHSGRAVEEEAVCVAGVRVALPERCAADALRWDDHTQAVPTLAVLLRDGHLGVDTVDRMVDADSAAGAGYSRMASAWQALRHVVARHDT